MIFGYPWNNEEYFLLLCADVGKLDLVLLSLVIIILIDSDFLLIDMKIDWSEISQEEFEEFEEFEESKFEKEKKSTLRK